MSTKTTKSSSKKEESGSGDDRLRRRKISKPVTKNGSLRRKRRVSQDCRSFSFTETFLFSFIANEERKMFQEIRNILVGNDTLFSN